MQIIRDIMEMRWIDAMNVLEKSGAQGMGDTPRHIDHIFPQSNILLKGFQDVTTFRMPPFDVHTATGVWVIFSTFSG